MQGQTKSSTEPSRVPRNWPYALALLCILVLAALSLARAPELPRVAANNWVGYWPLYLARHTAAAPFAHVSELYSSTEVMRAFRNDAIDVAALTLDEALQLAAEGFDIAVLLVVDISAGGDALVARSGIASLDALAGHRVAVESTAVGAYLLTRIYALSALEAGDVEVVSVPYGDHARMFTSGAVDAVITFDPVRSSLLAAGGHELFSSRDIPGEIVDVLVARRDYIAQHQAVLAALIGRWQAAVRAIERDRDQAFAILAPYTRGDRVAFGRAFDGIELPSAEHQRELLGGQLAVTAERLRSTMLEQRLLSQPPRGELAIVDSAWQAAVQ